MRQLWLYDFVSRAKRLNYRGKIMLMAFVGTHIPLLAVIAYFVLHSGTDFATAVTTVAVTLVATLIGTGITLFVLNELLRPIVMTSRGLQQYRTTRALPELPTGYADEAGTLMRDASLTLTDLDHAIDDLANYDKVTGLPNRASFLNEIAKRIGEGQPFAICATRLNGYDRLVQTFDQTTADRIVRRLADTLRSLAGDSAYVARIDGGLFASTFSAAGDIGTLAAAVAKGIDDPGHEIVVDGVAVVPDLSAGMALYPQDGSLPAVLLDNATAAVEPRNVNGDKPLHFYSPAARDAARERFLTEQELRRALVNSEFRLHYQPVVDTARGRTVGAEALIRWQHPDRGLLGPADFIPIAEASGLIDPIGRWVLDSAASQLREWANAGHDDLTVAINISARQFRDLSLIDAIATALRDNGVGDGRLEVELTETAAMQDRERAAGVFRRLRDLGVSIAIDDFGTGYSSMANLLDLPFDLLKIDRQFVSGVDRIRNAHAICAALIALGRNLNTEVLAEGVETAAETETLRNMGVRRFQGFYFARPLPPREFIKVAGDLSLTAKLMRAGERTDTQAERRIA
jgi:EAL domain-containing protein (putative c-di-GMP-specific phosphodiesterase class I)/GGDEF domain-containing protein